VTHRSRRVAGAALLLALAAAPAHAYRNTRVYDEKTSTPGTEVLLADNPHPWPAWVEVRLPRLRNLRPSRAVPLVAQLPPRSRRHRLLTLRQRRPGRYSFQFRCERYPGDPHAHHDGRALYAYPFAHGTKRKITQGNDDPARSHRGATRYAVDFEMPQGTPVHAARAGVVVQVVEDETAENLDPRSREPGNHVWILHPDGTVASYGHLRPGGVRVTPGQRVAIGDPIAFSGSTGAASGPHLHFQVSDGTGQSLPIRFYRHDGKPVSSQSLRRGQWVYSGHPGKGRFRVVLGEAVDAARLVGTREPAPATHTVTVESERIDDTILVYGVNGHPHTVSLDLSLTLENMRPEPSGVHPHLVLLGAHRRAPRGR